jgi:hypothetical protein
MPECACRLREPDGHELTVVWRGESFDVYHGKRDITVFAVTRATALQLGWFLLWRWWVLHTWCGLRGRTPDVRQRSLRR